MKTWKTIDKKEWKRGEWDNEPDKAHWIDEATQLDCLIVRNPGGALCGYVGVPESNKHFEVDYDDVKPINSDYIEVHGGLTFSSKCRDDGDETTGICHPEEGCANKDVWWLGFDCSHLGDVTPKYDFSLAGFDSYKCMNYVKAEVTQLAAQLAA